MSGPFEAPSSDGPALESLPPLATPLEDVHVVITAVLLLLYGVPITLLALMFPVAGVLGGLFDPEFQDIPGGFLLTGCIGTVEGVCIGIMGLLYAASGVGLFMGRRWAWILALCAAAIWLSSPCCLPFGAYCLFGLLRERTRRAYGIM